MRDKIYVSVVSLSFSRRSQVLLCQTNDRAKQDAGRFHPATETCTIQSLELIYPRTFC